MINNPVGGTERNDCERKCQEGAALVFIHRHFQIAEASAEKRMRQVEPADRVDVAARGVNIKFVSRQRAKQIVKARRQIAQTGAQIENVWS